MSGKPFTILAVDGGGVRGVFPAQILNRISAQIGGDLRSHFDMIAGTSSGAIVAAAVACGVEPSKVVALFKNEGARIFARRGFWKRLPKPVKNLFYWRIAFSSAFSKEHLEEVLRKTLGERTLGQVDARLLIPAVDATNVEPLVFKSRYMKRYGRDADKRVVDAVMASCSAPLFFDPKRVGNFLIADGGIWANNPALVAVIEAHCRIGIPLEKIKILSVGTGASKQSYSIESKGGWGLFNGWKGLRLVAFARSVQSRSIEHCVDLLLGKEQVIRIDPKNDISLSLDDASQVQDLLANADSVFDHRSEYLMRFFDNAPQGGGK